jgi:multidrug resistance efflux pump
MSSDTEAVILTDQQRIEQLEKAGKLNRLLIFGLAGALLLTLLTWLLVALLSSGDAADDQAQLASLASVEALHKELGALQLQIAPLQQQVKDQQKLILLQAQQQMTLPSGEAAAAAPTESRAQDHENVRMVARTLIGQEHNYQQTLTALKEGMRELANMTPGSRSWLDFYMESLAKPMADSQARVKALQQWSGDQATP